MKIESLITRMRMHMRLHAVESVRGLHAPACVLAVIRPIGERDPRIIPCMHVEKLLARKKYSGDLVTKDRLMIDLIQA